MLFSERNGITPSKAIIYNSISRSCKNRVINLINMMFQNYLDAKEIKALYINILDEFGIKIDTYIISNTAELLYEYLIDEFNELWEKVSWNQCFDVLEIMLQEEYYDIDFKCEINEIFEEEKMGYRIIDDQIVDITNESEIEEIEEAIDSDFNIVNDHIQKSLELYSDRKNPDYKNSIKESITAVESMCCIICGENVELGKALGRLEKNGIYIHGAMKNGFQSLYGYTSDESGIRHGGIVDKEVTEEDAKFMLVSCSAFVNYLKVKLEKMKENSNG